MSVRSEQTKFIGKALRTRLDPSSKAPSKIKMLLTKLAQTVTKHRIPSETGQEIANRLGLFAVGETVKRRVGIPGLNFTAPTMPRRW